MEGAGTNGVGTHIEAGLPNIVGKIGFWPYAPYGATYSQSGVIKITGANVAGQDGGLGFDAAKGETKADGITLKTDDDYRVFGKSDTVQPDSVCVNYIIKA